MTADHLPGGGRTEGHGEPERQQDTRHHALPDPQRHDRLTLGPPGPRHQARGHDGGQHTEQQQSEGDDHERQTMRAVGSTGMAAHAK